MSSIASAKQFAISIREGFDRSQLERLLGVGFILPATLVVSLIVLYPTVLGVWMSFFERSLLNPDETMWIGLQNFQTLFSDPKFWTALEHSVVLTVVVVTLEYVLGLGLALVLKQRIAGMRFFRSLFMLTWVAPIIVEVILYEVMFNPEAGPINPFLNALGFEGSVGLGDPQWAFPIVMTMYVWRNVPFFAITIMASLRSIPPELYEAAAIDGAGTIGKFRHITIPNIAYVSMIMIVLHVIFAFNQFAYVWLSTGGGPLDRTQILPTLVYNQAFQQYSLGYAASIGVVMLVIMLVFTAIYVRMEDY